MKMIDIVLAIAVAIFLAGASAYAGPDIQAAPAQVSQ
jgi:hypothetical protein